MKDSQLWDIAVIAGILVALAIIASSALVTIHFVMKYW